jgi:uncharacterized protein YegJ (DUF2314 family)
MPAMQLPEDDAGDAPEGDGPGAADGLETWELPTPVASAWVGFWPHKEAPDADEIRRSLGTWVGREIDAGSADPDDDDMIWTLIVRIPGVVSPVAFWAQKALEADPQQLPDPAMASSPWVIGMQTHLEVGEAADEYFHLMALLTGALPELTGVMDVANARRWTRRELDEQFQAADAVPNEEHLWTITAVAAREDDEAPMMLFTTGLARCGVPELEMLEVPARHAQAAAILINHVASLLLESPPPSPREPMEVGPDSHVALVPWKECVEFMEDEAPGSRAFRENAEKDGDASFAGVRAVVCADKKRGQFRSLWAWPKDIIDRMEDGRAVLYASEHAAAATERRAQRTWPAFATAFASVKRADDESISALADSAFHVQAPVGTVDDQDRREQGWFVVHRFDHDVVEATLSEDPVTGDEMHAGDTIRIPRDRITDWRVMLPEEMYGPERSVALLEAIDRLRGIA